MDNGVIIWWAELYRTHAPVQLLAGLGHILSVLFAARYALAGDRAALRAEGKPPEQSRALLVQIEAAHRPVLIGLSVALLTGLAQLAAQLDYLPRSPWWWLKLAGLVALLINGRVLQLAADRLLLSHAENGAGGRAAASAERAPISAGEWRALRAAARRSVALWAVLVLLGLLLTTVRP